MGLETRSVLHQLGVAAYTGATPASGAIAQEGVGDHFARDGRVSRPCRVSRMSSR